MPQQPDALKQAPSTYVPNADDRSNETSVLRALKNPQRLRIEVLAGLVVAIALIPEAISFSIIAGVDPQVGLFSSFVMAVVIAFTGGRPGMITAATGAIALVVAPLSREHGLDYLIAAVLLGGLFQIILAALGVAKLMRFIPRMVMVGFVNALAIMIFVAQLPHLIDVPMLVYPLVAASLLILVFWPKVTDVIPAPLVAIAVITGLVLVFGWDLPTVGDMGALPESLPGLFIPSVPLTWDTFSLIAPYAMGVALVGLMESLMTAKLVDDVTETHSNKTRESYGLGIANIASGLFGGMGGCAMIGQTMINVKVSGARTRISTFVAGTMLLVAVVGLGDLVAQIPMAVLVAVMIMVSVSTFDWHSVRPSTLRRIPHSENIVMLVTVVSTVATNNLAVGVILGVFTGILVFARRVVHFSNVERDIETTDEATGEPTSVRYRVIGELFFASSNDLVYQFDYSGDPATVIIDLTESHIWDVSTVASLDAITQRYRAKGKSVELISVNEESQARLDRLSGHLDS